jgi:anti-sigma-K factor RskA
MDQRAREDIAAAAAAHHELGRDYDGAVAEGLIERIGEEIDKRVDARLGIRDRAPRRPADPAQEDKRRKYWTGVAVGAGVASIPALLLAAHGSFNPRGLMLAMVGLWIAIAVVYFITTWARSRPLDRE